jgi:biuret amidohydrolase
MALVDVHEVLEDPAVALWTVGIEGLLVDPAADVLDRPDAPALHSRTAVSEALGQPGLPDVRRLDDVVVDTDDLGQLHPADRNLTLRQKSKAPPAQVFVRFFPARSAEKNRTNPGRRTVELVELVDPEHTALVTQECQNGVIGDAAVLRELADEAHRVAVPNIARLAGAARAVGVPVVHCLAVRRADDRGSNTNARLFAATRKLGIRLEPGSPEAEPIAELNVQPDDLILQRYHGIGPMGGTDLDAVLRNLGVRTIVGVGVSVNVAITNFVMDAVNHGYQFVLPRDAVAGVPSTYADAVIDNTLSLLATIVSTEAVAGAWQTAC